MPGLGPAWKNIAKLENHIVGDGIKIVVAVDETGQTLLCYFEERVERGEGHILRIGHKSTPVVVREVSLIGWCRITLPGTHGTISVVHQEHDYSLRCPMPTAD